MTRPTIKWLKRLSLVLAIIPILLFLAFAGAVSLIDFNQYKPQIEKEIGDLTNRELKIEGAVDVSILPFMFHVGDLRMKNPQGFAEGDMLTLKQAHMQLSLKKLFLDKKLEIISLELVEPKVNFIDKDDTNNWQNMPLLAGLFNEHIPQLASSSYATVGFNKAFLLKTKLVDDASLMKINNEQTEKTASQSAEKASAGEAWYLESLVISNAEINYKNIPQNFSTQLSQANLLTFDVRPGQAFKINTDFIYKHSQSPRKMAFDVNGMLDISEDFTQLKLSDWQGVLRLQLPQERKLPDIRLNTSGKHLLVDFKHQQIYVKDAILKGLESEVATSFQGEFGVDPVYQGIFSAKQINIKNWIEHLGLPAPQMKSPQALTKLGGKFEFEWNGEVLKLNQIDATLDATQINGSLSLPLQNIFMQPDLKKAATKTPFKFDLQLANLDMDFYQAVTPRGQSFYPIPLNWLQQLNAQGQAEINQFTFAGITADNLTTYLYAQAGELEFAPLDLTVEEGAVQSKLMVNLAQNNQQFGWSGRIDNMPLHHFAKNEGFKNTRLNSRFDLTTAGLDSEQWLAKLNGSLQADVNNVAISGIAIDEWLKGEWSIAKKPVTQLHEVRAVGFLENGVFTPKRLLIEGRGFSGSGLTSIDLAANKVTGELNLLVKPVAENMQALRGIRLPIKLAGNLKRPQFVLDMAALDEAYIESHPWLKTVKNLLQ